METQPALHRGEELNCSHCGQAVPPARQTPPSSETPLLFCCPGCEAVHQFIHQVGLQDYYRFRPEGPVSQPEEVSGAGLYEDPQVAAGLIFEGSFHCLLDGLHCAACAWLVERGLQGLDGLESVGVNYSTQRLRLQPQPGRLDVLPRAVERVHRLGYRAIAYDPNRQERPRSRADRMLLLRFGVAACAAGNVMLAAFALYSGADLDLSYRPLFHRLSLALTTPVVFFSAWPFWTGARNALRQGQITTDVSIALGLGITYLYSLVATYLGSQHVYFDTCSTFVFVLLAGRLLESAARSRAGSSLERLLSFSSPTAWLWDGQAYQEVPTEGLTIGDRVEVRPGARVPADGEVIGGRSYVDESHLTGESQPRAVEPGVAVYAGSLAVDGRLEVRLTQTGGSSMLAQVARLVESAQCAPAPVQRVADRVARWLLPIVLVLSLLTGLFQQDLDRALAVLIITCPCALGIATPLVVSLATGVAARRGILFRDGVALETTRQVTHVVLDKTGTLTRGELCLVQWQNLDPQPQPVDWLQVAASLEASCNHPLSKAFLKACEAPLLSTEDWSQVAGQGVEGWIEGRHYRLGRGPEGAVGAEALTAVWLEQDGRPVARFDFRDEIRPEARAFLRQLGLPVSLCSGDRREVVERVARDLGIEHYHANMLPQDKVEWIRALQERGEVVAFIGDGINDAPALRRANLGVAVANGSELSWEVADLVLLRPGLQPAVVAFDLARVAWQKLWGNLALAGLYNVIAIPAAAFGFVTPLWAAVAMPLSSLFVIAQSLTLVSYRKQEDPTDGRPVLPDSSSAPAQLHGPAPVRLGRAARPV